MLHRTILALALSLAAACATASKAPPRAATSASVKALKVFVTQPAETAGLDARSLQGDLLAAFGADGLLVVASPAEADLIVTPSLSAREVQSAFSVVVNGQAVVTRDVTLALLAMKRDGSTVDQVHHEFRTSEPYVPPEEVPAALGRLVTSPHVEAYAALPAEARQPAPAPAAAAAANEAPAATVVLTVPSEFVRPIGALFTITDPAEGARVEIRASGIWRGEAHLRIHSVDEALRFKFKLVECDAAGECRDARRLQANGPLTVRVQGPKGSGLVVIAPEVNRGGVSFPGRITDRVGEPPAEAPLPMRDVTWWTLATRARGSLVNAWQGFTELPDSFFMYVRTSPPGTRESPTLEVGEPLLKLGDVYLRANGQEFTFDGHALGKLRSSDFLTTERPARVVLPPPVPASAAPTFDSDELDDELLSSRPEIRAFVAARRKAFACGVDEWAKRDPSGKSFNYEVVSHDASGRVTKVELMVDKVQREINAACGTDKMFTQAVPLKNKLRAQWMKEIAKRFR